MASLKQMGRDKLESLRERRGEKKERERGKRAENQPIIEMASGKKRTGKHREAWNWQVVKEEDEKQRKNMEEGRCGCRE